MNLTTPGASLNSTTSSIWIVGDLEMCMLFIIFLVGLPTHIYIIWLIMTGTGSGVASEVFNLNLSVCEIGTCLNSLVFTMSHWFLDLINLSQFLNGLTITGRPLFQCLICVERYLAVVHPVTFLKFKALRYKVICCTATWIITLCSCFCCMLISMLSTSNAHAWFMSLQFLLFFSIQLFCLVAVLRSLKQSGPGERVRERNEENHMKKRAFYLILITTMSMFITYVLYIIVSFLNILTQNIPELWLTFVVCYMLASFVQPVLYLHRAGKLSYPCKICRCPNKLLY